MKYIQTIVYKKKFGRNPKCDRDWCENEIKKELKLQIIELKLEIIELKLEIIKLKLKKMELKNKIKKGNKSPNRKGNEKSKQKWERKVQIEKGKKSPYKNWKK